MNETKKEVTYWVKRECKNPNNVSMNAQDMIL